MGNRHEGQRILCGRLDAIEEKTPSRGSGGQIRQAFETVGRPNRAPSLRRLFIKPIIAVFAVA
jgi:hypothetical protein